MAEEPPSASVLPDEVIACVLSKLRLVDLIGAESACSCWRRVAADSGAWLALACRRHPELAPFVRDAPALLQRAGRLQTWEPTRRALCKRVAALSETRAPAARTIIAEALAASSTDNPEESVRNTLSRRVRNTPWHLPAYWSSAGSEQHDADDWLVYRLAAEVCVVSAVRLRPFRAFFQAHQPVYSPLRVRVMLGALGEDAGGYGAPGEAAAERDGVDSAVYHYTSPEFDVAQADELQTLTLPAPIICFGGVLRLQLCGRAQSQAADNRYYVCLAHVCAEGKPWYGFAPSHDGRRLLFDAAGALAGTAAPPLGGSSESEVGSSSSDDSDDEDDGDDLHPGVPNLLGLGIGQLLAHPAGQP